MSAKQLTQLIKTIFLISYNLFLMTIFFLTVTLEFFDDILIPPTMLQHPSRFDETEQAWIWEYDTGDGSKHDLFMDPGEKIRFKVISENFTEISPTGPEITEAPTQGPSTEPVVDNRAAYSLTVSIILVQKKS